MLPSGFPWIIHDGIAALRWRAALHSRFLLWYEQEAGEQRQEDAARHRGQELQALAERLEWLSDSMWADGSARDYVTIVDLALLSAASKPDDALLPAILQVAPEDLELQRREILALRKWLDRYLANGG